MNKQYKKTKETRIKDKTTKNRKTYENSHKQDNTKKHAQQNTQQKTDQQT